MKDSDYADSQHDLIKLVKRVAGTVKTLREDPAVIVSDLINDLEEWLDKNGYKGILALDNAKQAISDFEIPDIVDSGFDSENTSIDDADKLLAKCRDGSLFHIYANDGRFDEDSHDKYDSKDYDNDHLVVVRHDGDITVLVRISPSANGFEMSTCNTFDDLFTVGCRHDAGAEKTLPEAIAAARAFTFEAEEAPSV